MTIEELNSRISVVNANVKRLNDERQVNLGRISTLKEQLSNAVLRYKEKYGVEITAENLQTEVARVTAEKEKEISHIEQIFALIEAGNFDGANALAEGIVEERAMSHTEEGVEKGGVVGESNKAVDEVTRPAGEVTESVGEVIKPVGKVVKPSAPVSGEPAVQSQPTQPSAPVVPDLKTGIPTPPAPPAPPVAPPKPTGLSGLDIPKVEPAGQQQVGLSQPPVGTSKPNMPNSFSSILSGTEFDNGN